MPPAGICSECPNPLPSPNHKTCSETCRSRRSRRIRRARKKSGERTALPPELKALSNAVEDKVDEGLKEAVQAELRPIIREALTEDVLRAAADLVGLTPIMVAAIQEDLVQDKDRTLRQRAYTLLAKFTLGNQSIAPAAAEKDPSPMQVVFHLPRPDGEPSVEPVADAEEVDEEVRSCIECRAVKPEHAFVAGSERCQECHQAVRQRVLDRFGET